MVNETKKNNTFFKAGHKMKNPNETQKKKSTSIYPTEYGCLIAKAHIERICVCDWSSNQERALTYSWSIKNP